MSEKQKTPMLNITTGIFHNKMTFEAEFPNLVIVTGRFNRSSWVTSPAEFDEYGFCYAEQEEDQNIELYDLEATDEFEQSIQPTKEMKEQIIQFIKAQYI